MNLKQTKLHILHKPRSLDKKAKTGVSLHCHTENSREMLDFVPHYANKLPIIAFFWNREKKKYIKREGKAPDFSTAYWSPPLTAQDVFNIETSQLEEAGLKPIVSITDHDNIAGNLEVRNSHKGTTVPISLEWTVPYEYGFFHLGIHNLPESRADEITQDLLAFTFSEDEEPNKKRLNELFQMLEEIPEVLVIFNHPLWDIEIVGQERHEILLKNFLKEFGKWIHALEINGFRTWSENKAVIEMAEALGYPIATGGDRHGCKPNTVINLTNKNTFDEFVQEIRVEKRSEVVLMPEYKQPLHSRQLQSFAEILMNYPEFPEHRQRWFNRIFFDIEDGRGVVPLSDHGWENGGPLWIQGAIWTLGFLGSPKFRPIFAAAEKKKDRVPKSPEATIFETPDLQEITASLPSSPHSTSSPG